MCGDSVYAPSVMLDMASRLALSRMWEYRSSMARLIWPAIASLVDSGMSASDILVKRGMPEVVKPALNVSVARDHIS